MTAHPRPAERDWGRLVAAIREAKTALLVAHAEPDGDALGSALAVGLGLDSIGIRVAVSFPELAIVDGQASLPRSIAWLPGQGMLVEPDAAPRGTDIAIAFDSGSVDRLDGLESALRSARLFAAVDHHLTHVNFAGVSIVDPDAPATATLAIELLDRLGIEMSRDIGESIYAGLSTDTGSFRFASTTPETHELAARLMRAGIRHRRVTEALHDTRPLGELKLIGRALQRAVLEQVAAGDGRPPVGIVWCYVDGVDRDRSGVSTDAEAALIGLLRQSAEAEVAAVIKERHPGERRVSLRSRGGVDVGSLAARLGGGGHRQAAGYATVDDLDVVVADLRAAVAAASSSSGG